MLPIRDRNPSGIFPAAVCALVGLNAVAFLLELSMGPEALGAFVSDYGLVPTRVTAALRGRALLAGLVIPAFTSMFLHGGWLHLIGNMWYLWIFGDNLEARLGRAGFLAFYLFCGLAAGATQYILSSVLPSNPDIPMIGASGAIAGVLGAYAVAWPRARVVTIIPIFYFITFAEVPALFVLGFWFVVQLFEGAASLGVQFSGGGVAYGAHVGGFIVGAALIGLLPRKRPKARRGDW